MKHIVIIGNGISGMTAARYIRKRSDYKITVISSETEHFYSRTALMYIYMGHMKYKHTKPYEDWFWEKNKIDLVQDYVVKVDATKKELHLFTGNTITYDDLIIASGSVSNKFGWPGQDLKGVQGLYNYQDLLLMEKFSRDTKKAVIVGGGLIGIEMAEMFLSRNIEVTMLVRESSFWNIVLPLQESEMINRHILEHHVDLKLSTELKEIVGDNNRRVQSIVTNSGEKIDCEFVGLTVGVHPNIEFLKDSGVDLDRGVLVNEFLETNIPNVFAIGDCAQHRNPIQNRRPVEQVWYTGKMMGEAVAETLTGNRSTYQPGIWFNSAKFFDIEYQTYGWVWAQPKENEESIYWEHKSGKKLVRFVYDKEDKVLLGINVFGMRLDHLVCDKWLREKKTIDFVLEHLNDANFDPEFYKKYHKEIALLSP